MGILDFRLFCQPFGPESTGVLSTMSPDQAVMPGQMTRGSTQLPPHFVSMYDGSAHVASACTSGCPGAGSESGTSCASTAR